MRSFLAAMILSLGLASLVPAVAHCQPDDVIILEEFDDDLPPPEQPQRRRFQRPRRSWRDSPLVWGAAATALAIALPFGVFRVVRQMRYMTQQQAREKAPWERDA